VVLIVVVAVAVFAGAGMGVGLLLWREPARTTEAEQGGAATSAASAMRKATGGLDTSTGRARIGSATLVLPTEPFELYPDPVHVDGVVDVIFLANADVHLDYDGRHDWQATVALAQISSKLVGDANLDRAGARVMEELARRFYGGHATQIKRMTFSDRAVDGHPGVEVTAHLHYSAKDLPSNFDRVVVWLARCEDGSLIAAISSVPDDASPETRRLASAALETFSVN
jgi:hypothetical protein